MIESLCRELYDKGCFNSSDVGDVGIKNFSYVEKLKEAVDCKTLS